MTYKKNKVDLISGFTIARDFKLKLFLYLIFLISIYGIINISFAQTDTLSLCFISDTQNPVFFENLFFHSNKNAASRKIIFESIEKCRPNSVFHLGDIVGIGANSSDWRLIDSFLKKLSDKKINFYPIPGNHEYMLFPKRGIGEFRQRFPLINIYGYSKQYGSLAVVLFNSNFSKLSKEEINDEINWFRNTLQSYESDSLISFIIVGCHHAPFTNSKIVSPSYDDPAMVKFLDAFYNSSKCKLFLSGHAHSFEHFKFRNKDFLVIGGGGGLLHPLYTDKDAKFKDVSDIPLKERIFHYLIVKLYKKNLWVDLKMYSDDLKEIKTFHLLSFQ